MDNSDFFTYLGELVNWARNELKQVINVLATRKATDTVDLQTRTKINYVGLIVKILLDQDAQPIPANMPTVSAAVSEVTTLYNQIDAVAMDFLDSWFTDLTILQSSIIMSKGNLTTRLKDGLSFGDNQVNGAAQRLSDTNKKIGSTYNNLNAKIFNFGLKAETKMMDYLMHKIYEAFLCLERFSPDSSVFISNDSTVPTVRTESLALPFTPEILNGVYNFTATMQGGVADGRLYSYPVFALDSFNATVLYPAAFQLVQNGTVDWFEYTEKGFAYKGRCNWGYPADNLSNVELFEFTVLDGPGQEKGLYSIQLGVFVMNGVPIHGAIVGPAGSGALLSFDIYDLTTNKVLDAGDIQVNPLLTNQLELTAVCTPNSQLVVRMTRAIRGGIIPSSWLVDVVVLDTQFTLFNRRSDVFTYFDKDLQIQIVEDDAVFANFYNQVTAATSIPQSDDFIIMLEESNKDILQSYNMIMNMIWQIDTDTNNDRKRDKYDLLLGATSTTEQMKGYVCDPISWIQKNTEMAITGGSSKYATFIKELTFELTNFYRSLTSSSSTASSILNSTVLSKIKQYL